MLVYYGYVLIHSQLREQRNPLFEKNNWTVLKSVRPTNITFVALLWTFITGLLMTELRGISDISWIYKEIIQNTSCGVLTDWIIILENPFFPIMIYYGLCLISPVWLFLFTHSLLTLHSPWLYIFLPVIILLLLVQHPIRHTHFIGAVSSYSVATFKH